MCLENEEQSENHGRYDGKIIDYGLKDNQNMGACMAPAACDTIAQSLVDFNREPADYDRIVTGDLGVVGREILLELLKKKDTISRNSTVTAAC